ncbi:MAG: phenylalanine--tRNA ligase subunit alpha [Erysipelotrichaceae bacterium]|nr:phenylalanine--tRNA ligase subunit alpha [Erysipelotrichaceae bacterium]MDD4642570.1 phenylalanine--tRNA ligase subunit alpha [Erysipelotrichaceae bacterium]
MQQWDKIKEEGLAIIRHADNLSRIEQVRIDLLGKKGQIQDLMKQMKDLDNHQKPLFGKMVNELKQLFEEEISIKKNELEETKILTDLKKDQIDISLDGDDALVAQLHPLTIVQKEVESIFMNMGYQIVEGPEVELDLYNFERANIPMNHPARDMQDTFYIDLQWLLRTHTTAIQTRVLETKANNLPIKVICPGKTYRRDDDDATHSHQFTQMEGLVVGEGINLADLKGTLEMMVKKLFGESRTIRLRPSYFQFTEPSMEVDVSCFNCNGLGCHICKKTGWIEILGAGMVHPKVLEMAGIDFRKYSGFAFGMGVERVAMLKYGIDDIRNFYLNDMRFLSNFDHFE